MKIQEKNIFQPLISISIFSFETVNWINVDPYSVTLLSRSFKDSNGLESGQLDIDRAAQESMWTML